MYSVDPYISYFTIGALVGAFIPMMAAWEAKRFTGEPQSPGSSEELTILMLISVFCWPFVLGALVHALGRR